MNTLNRVSQLLRSVLVLGTFGGCSQPQPPHALQPDRAAPAASPPVARRLAPSPQVAPAPTVAFLVPPAPPAPPYVLADDIQEREERAKAQLGRASTRVVKGVYLLVSPDAQGISSYAPVVEQALTAYMNDRFTKLPERAVSVYLFRSNDAYQSHCKKFLGGPCISIFGFYEPNHRALVMNAGTGIGTLTHELVHPIVEADFPSAPTWVNEGIASLYEAPVFWRAGEVRGVKNWRYRRISSALASKAERDIVSLTTLFTLSEGSFRDEKEDLHYAVARYACQWLEEKKLLWAFYKQFRDNAETDPTGEAAFTSIVGSSPALADAAWKTWLARL